MGFLVSLQYEENRGGHERSFDAGKQTFMRKLSILVDTLGLLFLVVIHSAGAQDRVVIELWRRKMALTLSILRGRRLRLLHKMDKLELSGFEARGPSHALTPSPITDAKIGKAFHGSSLNSGAIFREKTAALLLVWQVNARVPSGAGLGPQCLAIKAAPERTQKKRQVGMKLPPLGLRSFLGRRNPGSSCSLERIAIVCTGRLAKQCLLPLAVLIHTRF